MNHTTTSPPKKEMTAREFLAWSEAQPEGTSYELVDGEVVAMAPERVRHTLTKGAVYRALHDAVQAAGVPCTVFTDGISAVINDYTVREPDASVQCGIEADLEALTIDQPLIVVEVSSPSSERKESRVRFVDYFSVPSIRHYLIVFPNKRLVVHHQRNEEGHIGARFAHDGEIALDPPGIKVPVVSLLGPLASVGKRGDR